MADAKVIEKPRPHSAEPAVVAKSNTSPKEKKQGKVVLIEVPKLTDIPSYMDALGWKVSGALMRRWFAANAREMTLDEKLGKTPPSKYPSDLVDSTTVTLDWILSFERVKKIYQSAISSSLFGSYGFDIPEAKIQLAKRLKQAGLFTTKAEIFGDLLMPAIWQHEHWQFRFFRIDTAFIDRLKVKINGLDDLFGALGGFALYLSAFGRVVPVTEVKRVGSLAKTTVSKYEIEITHIAIYARDTYDFIGNQYLGHWNKNGVEVVSFYVLEDKQGALKPNDYKPSGDPPDIKLPVGNWSFNDYRKKHDKGGDLLIFSDVKIVRLKRSVKYTLTLQEIDELL